MDKKGFELLIQNGLIDRIVLSRDASLGEGWQIYIYDEKGMSWSGSRIRAARGDYKTCKTVEAALTFLRACGWHGNVELEERFKERERTA